MSLFLKIYILLFLYEVRELRALFFFEGDYARETLYKKEKKKEKGKKKKEEM